MVSVYDYEYAQDTWTALQGIKARGDACVWCDYAFRSCYDHIRAFRVGVVSLTHTHTPPDPRIPKQKGRMIFTQPSTAVK